MIIALMFGTMTMDSATGVGTSDAVIAKVGAVEIRYGEIRCQPEDEACRESEQELFRIAFTRAVFAAACGLEGWSPSSDEIAAFRPAYLSDENKAREIAERVYALPRLIRRVYAGETATLVYADAIRELPRLSFERFKTEIKRWRSLETVDRYLAVNAVERLRESGLRFAADRATQEHFRSRIAAEAAATNTSYASAADAFFDDLVKRLPIRVLNDQFALPAGKEVFR